MGHLSFSQFNRELNRMYKESNDFYHALAKQSGLSDSTFWILYTLRESEAPLSATDLGRTLFLSKQTIHSGVKWLEQQELIKVSCSSGDRRSKEIRLTEKGKAFARNSVDRVFFFEEQAFFSLEPEERRTRLQTERHHLDALWKAAEAFLNGEGTEVEQKDED